MIIDFAEKPKKDKEAREERIKLENDALAKLVSIVQPLQAGI